MRTKPIKACLALAAAFVAAHSIQAQTITPAMAIPRDRVDLTKTGMKGRIYRGTSALAASNIASGEAYISGFPWNPGNLVFLNIPNGATPNYDLTTPPQPPEFENTRWWVYPIVNIQEQVDPDNGVNFNSGNFNAGATAPHNIPDRRAYGTPIGGADYYVMEFTGYLDLRQGTTRFGVNSDDGFKLTIGVGTDIYAQPSGTTPAGVQLIVLDGTRGAGNTEANITVTQAGLYPFRLLYWENTGAAGAVEFYTFGPGATSGNRYLVGDTLQPTTAVQVYYDVINQPAQITGRFPFPGTTGHSARPEIRAQLERGDAPIDQTSLTLKVDGVDIPFTLTEPENGDAPPTAVRLATAVGAVGPHLPGTVHTVVVAGRDTAEPPVPFSYTWTFTTANYPTVPPAYSVGSVNTEKPGFRSKLEHTQAVQVGPQTSTSWFNERRIAKGYFDPITGLPFPNLAEAHPDMDAEGYLTDADVINYNDTAGGAAGSFPNDEAHPAGLVAASERFVFGIETILELQPGIYRLGVNSDDGFRLTAGRAPGDVTGIEVAVANVDRGPTDSFGDVNITEAGFYPFRLMWWETGGGAAAEFFLVGPDGTKTLINDTAAAGHVKAWRESANTPPAVTRVLPVVNEPHAYADQDVIIDITEKAFPVDIDNIILKINNVVQTIAKTRSGNTVSIVRDSSVENLLPSGANDVILTYTYTPTGGAATTVDATWRFTVAPYTRVVPAGNRVPLEQVTGTGFTLHQVNHIWRGGTDQGQAGRYISNGGGANNWPGPEIQLARGYLDLGSVPFQNLSPAPYADGPSTENVYPVINFNTANGGGTGNTGFMNGDVQVPFVQSTVTTGGPTDAGRDNFVQEYITYIDLKKGAHIFGVNVDDGFSLHSSPNARDTLGTLLAWKAAPGGQLGFPFSNLAFNVVVEEDGIYPLRLLYWEGGGDTRVEFIALDRNTGRLSVVNNADQAAMLPTQPGAPLPPYTPYLTYSTYTGPVRPWTKFSVYPIRAVPNSTFFNNPIQQTGPGPITIRLPNNTSYAGIANDNTQQRPFGDAVGGVVADLGAGSVSLKVDGEVVPATVTDLGNGDKEVKFTPAQPLTPGTHTAALIYAGVENTWTFITINHVNVDPAVAIPASRAVTASRGFLAKVAQTTAARTGANSGNSVASAEAQLAAGPGIASVNANRPDGAFIVSGAINQNINKNNTPPGADLGNFTAARSNNADDPFPGLVPANNNNFTVEYTGWLELPAGYQKFGWGGDDGVHIEIRAPGATSSQVLLTMDRGAGERDFPFAFVTPVAGLYPVRILYYQGGGGGNLELFTYGANGSKHLVNDPNNPASVKAYYEVTPGGTPDPEITITSFTGGVLSITWSNGGELQTATGLPVPQGGWTGTGNSTGSAQITVPNSGNLFLRINRP